MMAPSSLQVPRSASARVGDAFSAMDALEANPTPNVIGHLPTEALPRLLDCLLKSFEVF